ncbi:hypothetical protein SO802_023484 [Lithocarpus litseifolius]|uniref:RNase H type-1 domain-containing protein n=1 Tax=Lithocarpus litseifolius TaxID=425828 RepID=A0AAW2C6D1_9ROSI
MDNLFRRQIVASDRCNICKTHPEDILHVVWGCTEVANLWKALTWAQHAVSPPPGDFTNLFSSFLQVRDDYGVEFFAITSWLLWNRRNAIRLDRSTRPLNQVLSVAGEMLHDFLDAQDEVSMTTQVSTQPHWNAPTQTRYKANFDGALFSSTDVAGLGVVIRDNVGAVIGALSMRIPLPQSVATVETLACRRAVQFAVEIGLHEVIFEGDAAVVIQAVQNREEDQSAHGHIVGDIQDQVSFLAFSDFCLTPRSCNRVADALAKRARTGPEFQVWLEDYPQDIAHLVMAEVT